MPMSGIPLAPTILSYSESPMGQDPKYAYVWNTTGADTRKLHARTPSTPGRYLHPTRENSAFCRAARSRDKSRQPQHPREARASTARCVRTAAERGACTPLAKTSHFAALPAPAPSPGSPCTSRGDQISALENQLPYWGLTFCTGGSISALGNQPLYWGVNFCIGESPSLLGHQSLYWGIDFCTGE